MTGAFAYLILSSARNALLSRIRQLRNPRYAIALVLGLGYFWLVFFRPSSRGGAQPNPLASETFGALAPVGVMVYVAIMWIVGADRAALAFTQAEVSMLFTGPISRRGLIIYKLVRAQAAVLTTSIMWLVFSHGTGGLGRVIASWVFLTTFSMHRLGIALLRATHGEHGLKGLRRSWLSIVVFGAAAGVVVVRLLAARPRFMAVSEPGEFAQIIISEFARAPLSWVLLPFKLAVAPVLTHTFPEWASAILPALVLLALHIIWVLRSDSAFEEAAVDASAAQAQRIQALRARGAAGGVVNPKKARRSIPLSPTGAPEMALLWKNYLWLIRTGQIRGLVVLPALSLVGCLAFAGRSTVAEIMVVSLCVIVMVVVVIFGPITMRNDLRDELRRLPMLKTMPLKGREIILAEVASSASPTAAMQFLLGAVALLALSFVPKNPLPVDVRVAMLVAAPVFLMGLNLANFTIHNGLALLFPAWVRLGDVAGGGAGVEVMGQMMLTLIITMLLLAILLVLPLIAGAAVYFGMQFPPFFAVAGAGIAAGIGCGLEAYLLMGALGGSLDRLEPTQLG